MIQLVIHKVQENNVFFLAGVTRFINTGFNL